MGRMKRIPSPHVYPLPNAPFNAFYHSLPKGSALKAIVDEGLDALSENRLAGISVGKNKIPHVYTRRLGISNLYKMNLKNNYRMIYTLITMEEGVCPHVIELMTHSEYLKRFDYKGR